jgi:hypothetical protein
MSEYLSLYNLSYGECSECKERTPHICLKCHYRYSGHYIIERIEKEQENNNNILNLLNLQGAQKIGLATYI